jgi:hypothetical protein
MKGATRQGVRNLDSLGPKTHRNGKPPETANRGSTCFASSTGLHSWRTSCSCWDQGRRCNCLRECRHCGDQA